MRRHLSKILAFSLILTAAVACGGSPQAGAAEPKAAAAGPEAATPATGPGLRIELAMIYVDDQDKALRFYTEVLGFAVKDDVSNEGFRWLTVTSPAQPGGPALLLALNADPAAKAYQAAMFQQGQNAIMFNTSDVKADYERIKAAGAEFTMPPTEVTAGSIIAILKDTCGNLVQITQLDQ
jgi:predicted enzyme related to lactoylglutathione lyase